MVEVIGVYCEPGDIIEGLELTFSPCSVPLKQRWRNNGLSADFLADYVTTFFPGDENDPASSARRNDIRSAVNYISNELLENAMKYADAAMSRPICMKLTLSADAITFSESNAATLEQAEAFRAFIGEFVVADPADFYLRQVERADDGARSGLGLVTMTNDYGACLGWKFEPIGGNDVLVTTQVRIEI